MQYIKEFEDWWAANYLDRLSNIRGDLNLEAALLKLMEQHNFKMPD